MRFKNRRHAAQLLAEKLHATYKDKNPLILGVPRGAVPMAKLIADALGGELDVVLVHKLTHPEQPELAVGAIDEQGQVYISEWAADLGADYLEAEKQRQLAVLAKRRATYTPSRQSIDPYGRIVIVVDDGIATGSTMIAALRALRGRNPKLLVGAVAVASPQAARAIRRECDALVCLQIPAEFYAVGQFFDDFDQVSDAEVIATLKQDSDGVSALG